MHLPTLGLREALNKCFYQLISCYVYFHRGTKESLGYKYDAALSQVNSEINNNNNSFKNNNIQFKGYEKKRIYLQNKKSQLNRDARLSITNDRVCDLLNKIKKLL